MVDAGQVEVDKARVLLGRAGVENDHFVVWVNPFFSPQRLQALKANGALGTNSDTFRFRYTAHPFDNLVLPAGNGLPAAGTQRIQDHEIPDGRRDAQTACHRFGIREGVREPVTLLKRPDDRRTALALAAYKPRPLVTP